MPEQKHKKRNSVPPQRVQGARDIVPERPSAVRLPNSARASLMEQGGGDLSDELERRFREHRLPSEERENDAVPGAEGVPQLDDEGIRQLRNDLNGNRARPSSKKPGNWFTRGVARLWEKTGGSMLRSHRRAYEDIMRHKTDGASTDGKKAYHGSYYKIGKLNRALNFINNPLATIRSWGIPLLGESKESWKQKQDHKDAEERREIEAYKQSIGGELFDKNKWDPAPAQPEEEERDPLNEGFIQEPEEQEQQNAPEKKPEEKKSPNAGAPDYNLIPFSSLYDKVAGDPNIINEKGFVGLQRDPDIPGALVGVGANADLGMGVQNGVQTLRSAYKTFKNVGDSFKGGLTSEKAKSVLGVFGLMGRAANVTGRIMKHAARLGNFSEKDSDALNWSGKKLFNLFGKPVDAGKVVRMANDSIKIAQSSMDIGSGARTLHKLDNARTEINELGNVNEKTRLGTLAAQAKRGANHRILSGLVGAASGGINIANNFTGGIVTPVLKGLKFGVDKFGGLGVSQHQKAMNVDVLNQEMGLEDKINEYAKQLAESKGKRWKDLGAFDYRALKKHAKHIILKANGFTSGKRSEAAAYFTENRAKYLANRANGSVEDEKVTAAAQRLVNVMGVDRSGKDKTFSAGDIAKRLGMGMGREKAAATRGSNITALANKGRGFKNAMRRFGKWLIGA